MVYKILVFTFFFFFNVRSLWVNYMKKLLNSVNVLSYLTSNRRNETREYHPAAERRQDCNYYISTVGKHKVHPPRVIRLLVKRRSSTYGSRPMTFLLLVLFREHFFGWKFTSLRKFRQANFFRF